MKLLCFYLPQFYETEENNRWWGKGYTDWVAARNAMIYDKRQRQPRVPLKNNYYDLSDENAQTLKWQAKLAKQYGIYGFCIYHYWFAGKRMLEKPVEILRSHKEIDIHYSLCWDNNTWKRTWYANKHEQEILIEQNYGDEEIWTRHFMDMLPDFQDERYIKIKNKPVFHIYRANQIKDLVRMKQCWNRLAVEYGFDGIYLVAGDIENREKKELLQTIDAYYNFEPTHCFQANIFRRYGLKTVIICGIKKRINKILHTKFLPDVRDAKGIYHCIMKDVNKLSKKVYYGIFVDYDDTPRRQRAGAVYINNSIGLFKRALEVQIRKSVQENNEFLYINAWNEWGEAAYLEPDEVNRHAYLECVRNVLMDAAKE